MPSPTAAYLLAAFCIAAIVAGQLLIKAASNRIEGLWAVVSDVPAMAYLVAALAIYLAAAIGWMLVLQRLPLSQAYLLMAIPLLAVPFAAHFVFGETLTVRLLLGAMVVAVGVWIGLG